MWDSAEQFFFQFNAWGIYPQCLLKQFSMFFNPQFLSLQHFVHTLDDTQESHGGAELFGRVHGIV